MRRFLRWVLAAVVVGGVVAVVMSAVTGKWGWDFGLRWAVVSLVYGGVAPFVGRPRRRVAR